jgi:succinate dehydrogenase / fumarate reductase cytochrome b subunit
MGREGHYAFLLHRLTGLGTLLFLIIHILDTSTVYFFPSLYEHAIAIYRATPFMLGEVALVFSIIYHGVNGLRIAVTDLWMPKRWSIKNERNAVRATLIIAIIIWTPAAIWMMIGLLKHNFGIDVIGMLPFIN